MAWLEFVQKHSVTPRAQRAQNVEDAIVKYSVLLDTNILVYRTDLLQDPIGQALTHTLRDTDGRLALPSIVRQETEKHALLRCRTASEQMGSNVRTLERLAGYSGYFEPPTDDDIRQAINARLRELQPLTQGIEWTVEDVSSALQRIMDEQPPNGPQNQQFKDSLLWEAARRLLRQAPVHLVTEDKAFYEGRQTTKGLSLNLLAEVQACSNKLTIHSTLDECLSFLTIGRPDLQTRQYFAPLLAALAPLIRNACGSMRIAVGQCRQDLSLLEAFPTDDPNAIAIKFHLAYGAERFQGEDKPYLSGTLHVFGATLASPVTKGVSKGQIHHMDFSSPRVGDGRIWLRVANELGDRGPLPVDNPPQWIVKEIPQQQASGDVG